VKGERPHTLRNLCAVPTTLSPSRRLCVHAGAGYTELPCTSIKGERAYRELPPPHTPSLPDVASTVLSRVQSVRPSSIISLSQSVGNCMFVRKVGRLPPSLRSRSSRETQISGTVSPPYSAACVY